MLRAAANPNAARLTFTTALSKRTRKLALLLICLALSCLPVLGQNIQNPQSSVDHRMRSDLKVDPATGVMQLEIPLGEFRGRGEAGLPIRLNYSSKVWNIKHYNTQPCNGEPVSSYRAEFANGSVSGWTSSLGWFLPAEDLSFERYDAAGNPVPPPSPASFRIMRKFIRLPDGSRHEVRRDDIVHDLNAGQSGVYYAVDGSRIWYDTVTDTVFMPNGSRILNYGSGRVQGNPPTQIVDRNGNFLTFDATSSTWNDTLNRTIAVPFGGDAPSAGNFEYTLPGGLTYTLRWRNLADARTDPNQALRFKGDTKPPINCSTGGFQPNHLFSSVNAGHWLREDGPIFNPVVLWQISLPNNTNYTFTYNVYGEMDKIVYPTGGTEQFTYGVWEPLGGQLDDGTYSQANRGVNSRAVSDGVTPAQVWTYGGNTFEPGVDPATDVRVVTAPNGTVTRTWYYISRGTQIKYGFDDARTGMVREVRVYDSAGTMLRRTVNQVVRDGPQPGGWQTATRNARVAKTVEIILDTGGDALAATTEMFYDADLNVTSTKHYDFVSISQTIGQTGDHSSIPIGSILRTVETDYLTGDPNYRARNLLSLATATRIRNSGGSIVAQSTISYDEAAFPLLPYETVTNWSDPGTNARGNVTTVSNWLNTTGANLQSHVQYDQCGNARKIWDARDIALTNPTQVQYSDIHHFAYPTINTSADPDGNGPLSSLVTTTEYDTATGFVTATTDANGQRTTLSYNDPLLRLKQVIRATGDAAAKNQTTYTYDDIGRTITVESDLNTFNDNVLKTVTLYDGLGRTTETQLYEGGTNYIATQTQYDTMGRAHKTSNPFRPWQLETPLWTTTAFDALGRVTFVTTPDGAQVLTEYPASTTGMLATAVTVTDQAGKKRRSLSDALGRLKRVDEPDSSNNPGLIGSPHQPTSYAYDAQDNLTTVAQGIQTRTFVYDSLKRLTAAINPESGTIDYQYDNNGNLIQKADARDPEVTTTYIYDALNRSTGRTYSDATPAVTYAYDSASAANSKGRLTSATSTVSVYTYGEYDALGRIKTGTQTTAGQSYSMSYSYDLAGNMKSQTYPSGRVVATEIENAGRLAGVRNQTSGVYYAGAAASDSLNRLQYSAHGAIKDMKLGNGLWEHANFNTRLQPTEIGLGTTQGGIDRLKLNYDYGTTDNNGNVRSQTITVPTVAGITGFTATQDYTYDALNRIATAQENTGTSWTQNFSYDRYGNRNFSGGTTLPAQLDASNNPILNLNNNRIDTAASGQSAYTYDGAGNLTHDAVGHAFAYDAENRQTTYDGGATTNGGATYYYDGDGRRVKKVVGGSPMVATVFVYNVAGQLVAEYSDATPSGPGGPSYLTSDTLGSPRVITGPSQEVRARHDYLPFGEEIAAGFGARATTQGYIIDTVRQQFTLKERDNETGLDYFGARYYGSTQGRFMSTDPIPVTKESFLNPQRWNLYAYVNNNPLGAVDPNGADGQGKGGDKIISVFLDYGVKDLGRRITKVDGKVTRDVPNTSDWQGARAGAPSGYQVEIFGQSDVTGNKGFPQMVSDRAFNNALKNSDVVIYIGHGRGDPGRVPFQQEGIQVGTTYYTPGGTGPAIPTAIAGPGPFDGPKPETTAGVVVNLSCDADRNGGAYFNFVGQNQVMVTLNSRGDGLDGGVTSYDALDKAANAFVKTYVSSGGNVQKAVDAANAVLASIPGNQNQNVGDEIKRKKVN